MHEFEIDTLYKRVLPRDAFNESKLLKCIGRLCLLIHDELIPVKIQWMEDYASTWTIGQCNDGYLIVEDLDIYVKGKRVYFRTLVNNKENYPFFAHYKGEEYRVFDERGEWDTEFIEFVKNV